MSALGGKTLNNDIFGLWVAAFMVGCAAYLTLSVDLAVPPAGLIALLGVIWLTQRWNWVVMFLLLISGVLAGLVWTDTQSQINATAVHQLSLGPLDVWGRIDHMEHKGQKVRYVLSDLQYDPPLTTPYPKKIRISAPVSANSPIRVGDDIWLRARLNPLPPPVYPDGFDFARNLYFKSIGAIGYSYSPAELDKSRTDLRWSDHISRLRSLIGQRIDVSLDGQVAAIAKALLIGERSEIDDDRYEQIRRSGLAHIMAISGLHMGMVTGLIFLFVT
ncbi:MAG: ComEC family competence protein, partial [Sphingomonadales bacterium]|nr:ComEC family competence protein [Sphingomonadales bacterium]